jgi:glycosyltransferase involved in cell wall biosynthesis
VVYNALALRPGGSGVQTYIRHLLGAMPGATAARLAALVQADAAGELPPGVQPRPRPVAAGWRRALTGLVPAPGADLVHGLNVALPVGARCPAMATVHDLAYFDVPWAFSPRRAAAARLHLRSVADRAAAIVVPSEFTAERLRARLGRRATVIPEAAPPGLEPPDPEAVDAVRRRYRLPSQFILHVGNLEPRKEVAGLAAACRQAQIPLVIAGAAVDGGPREDTPGALRLGYVPAPDLAALYGAASVFAYVSVYEGFGLPPLEAMACGAAVIASDIPPLREALGTAAEFVAPRRADQLAIRLRELMADEDRRREMGVRGRRHAARRTWDDVARATVEVYRDLGLPA